ncbi:glycerol-1-phosphate prenyltransferase [Shouchella lehensis G1]|uniref:Heptaprenylglyceryl phosphate synthase n=2 Tax=Shouchella lehensis TaxID=300825 RepID=A0A060LZB2_9BACI|nr:glycerol-1-phosphate prenyltransferase [Shouchella lehensis G1]
MMNNINEWSHVFKLDPNKELTIDHLERLCESGTDAVIVGGTDGVTLDNTLELLVQVRRYPITVALEVSNMDSITPGFDYYLIPTVLNSRNPNWIIGQHHQAMKEYGELIDWDTFIPEGYCVLNPNAKVAELTDATTDLSVEDVTAYARLAENMLHLPFFYIEYSGQKGSVDVVKEAKAALSSTKLIYGGGIETAEEAKQYAQYADVTVVGNAIYTNFKEAIKTVKAVKGGAS